MSKNNAPKSLPNNKQARKPDDTLDDDELTLGVHEQKLAEDEPGQSDNAKTSKKRSDSELLSIFSSGLPTSASKNAKTFDLLYDWENTKGREKNIRSPSIKPEATNQDAEVLAVFRRKSATIAWEHLQQVIPKMNPEDPSNENPVKNRSKSRNLESPSVPEVTQTGSAEDFSETIEPEHLNPPLRRPTQEPEPPPKPKPVAKPKPRPQCPTPCDDPCCPCSCAVPSYICCPPTLKMYYDVPGCEPTGQVTRGSCDQTRRVSFKETAIMIPDAPRFECDSDSGSEGFRLDPIPPNPVQKRPPPPQVTKRRRAPRPPWRDPSEVFCKQELPVSKETFQEYWTIDGRETHCCLPLSLLDPCEVPLRSTRPDPCRVKSTNPDKDYFHSLYQKIDIDPGNPCCAHPCLTTVPGRIPRLLPWAPCTPIPRTLLLCQHCGAAFCGKYNREDGRYVALEDFCGYAVADKDGIISFNPYNPDNEHLPEPTESPNRVKCSCQRCRSRMSQRRVDQCPDCKCSFCKQRLVKCLNQNYYAWLDKKNNSNTESDSDVNELQDELTEPSEAAKPVKDCKLPECLCRDQKPGEPLKNCECRVSKDQKAKCMMACILHFGNTSQLGLPTLLGSKPQPEIPTNSDNKNPRKVSPGSLKPNKSPKKKIAYDNDSTENKEVDPTAKVESKPVATPDIRKPRDI